MSLFFPITVIAPIILHEISLLKTRRKRKEEKKQHQKRSSEFHWPQKIYKLKF